VTALRKVMVSKWNKATDSVRSAWEEVGEAFFHGFGSDYEESSEGFGNFSTAIVEWPTGQIEMVRADKIRFLHPIITSVDKSKKDGTATLYASKEGDSIIVHGLEYEAPDGTTQEYVMGSPSQEHKA
jgi:hypothetical protein